MAATIRTVPSRVKTSRPVSLLQSPAVTPEPDPSRRNERSRRAILAATIALIGELGYDRVSVEAIAKRAGVGKQTIYRWWPSKADLFLEAFSARSLGRLPAALPSGDAFVDLEDFLRRWFLIMRNALIAKGVRSMIAEAQLSEEFRIKFEDQFVATLRKTLRETLRHGIELRQIRSDADLETALDMILGAIWHRLITGSASPLNEAFATALVALVKPALAATARTE